MKRVIVRGKAGSGKSTVIKETVKIITTALGEDAVEITAPTGMAAVNVNGKTFHSLLQLPVNYKKFGLLENQKAKKLQSDLKNLKFLIIDEMSLRFTHFVSDRITMQRIFC